MSDALVLSPRPAPSVRDEMAEDAVTTFAGPARGPAAFLTLSNLVVTFALRWKLIVLAFVAPIVLALAIALMVPTRYTAETVLMVLVSRENAGATDLSGFGPNVISVEILKAVRAEIEILRSEEVLRRAVTRVGIARLFPDMRDPKGDTAEEREEYQTVTAVENLRRALRSDADTTSNVLRVWLTLPDRDVALATLRAILDAYLERRADLFAEGNSRLLSAEAENYRVRLRELESAIGNVKARYGIVEIASELQLTSTRLDGIVRREDQLREQATLTDAQLRSAEARLAAQPTRVYASSEATNVVSGDEARNSLTRLLQERERMAAQYAPGWPGLADLDQRIAAARAAMRDAARNTFQTTRETRNPVVDQLASRVATLQVEKDAIQQQLVEVGRQRQAAEVRGAELVQADAQLRDLGRQRDGLEVVVRQLITREAGTRIEEDSRRQRSPSINIVQSPTAPLRGTSGRRLIAAGGVIAGMALAGITLLLLALTRRSFATTEEAEGGLGLPSLASFASLKPSADDMKRVPEVADFVAMMLDVRISSRRPCLIQLVSTGVEDGREELGRSIALEYARRTDTDILLIDLQSDGRAQLAALGSQPMEVERVPGHLLVFNTVVPNLWISYDAQNSSLLDPEVTIEGTRNLLERLRRAFDAVIVIGPDFDGNYAMRRLTAMMDANVIVVRGERTEGARARALRDWILGSGGTLLGFVFTGRRKILPRALARIA
ncbi:GumC family protein [Roseomonas populi]|uniref:Wzz/FepE/Etk N-terminal domain-containing protein n=1 Tax=Roseomonas populi TaxID=3121582 RepID=A0ABT1X2I1_9PROT|nr:Wzz/FepE/Etk N-terminal domain-containing protein [Roseomonas pecuniae]MCR0982325.1 Wzz/FepE/Etk N-terminal domain-containing protein [Roseomonas pecuniae]